MANPPVILERYLRIIHYIVILMLYSYKMTHDTGFAPNPFHGVLSLATCKPLIRLKKHVGDYIAGFTSKELCQEKPGQERLIFIMKVTEKIPYDIYWNDPRFAMKKPGRNSDIELKGDNIYKPLQGFTESAITTYEQVPNYYHGNREKKVDLNGKYVLLSNEFFYLGSGAIPIDRFNIKVPRYHTPHGFITNSENTVKSLLGYLQDHFPKNVPVHTPHGF
ncbi:hypothetical protein [Pseudoflavitalea rhizosphaerae]|uniref:Nmad2 family putative nucleotide modification protein n=1 Tax=Pseudoflavitalea rhizosphaerae TaxID=1884793 RepID=UPI000F8CC8E9|nr:hypothetical protein [Pseudoflavitalea rhizosphaerae]